ncbi:MAG: hypothetical protein ABWY06_16415 [Pseudomonas sp.]|uniref:hypothetical protein n=1 Tax=Pseudomonas sp. TaxID=306 RepID=UPI003396B7DD
MRTRLLALALPLLLIGCSQALDYSVDNPTGAPLKLQIDGTAYEVPAHAATEVTLEPGAHSLRSEQLGEVKFIVYRNGKSGLINPTLSDYVIARETYITDEANAKNFADIKTPIVIEGVTFEANHELTRALFIDKQWTLGVREPFPETMEIHTPDKLGGNFVAKIFTAKDYIAYFETRNEVPGYFEQQRPETVPSVLREVEVAPPLPELPPELEAHAKPMRELFANYLKATDASEQERLQDAYFDTVMAYTSAAAPLYSKLTREANEQANQFILTEGKAIGSSTAVIAK